MDNDFMGDNTHYEVVIPLEEGQHDLDPETHVFPIMRQVDVPITIGSGDVEQDRAAIIALVEANRAEAEGKKIAALAESVGLHPGTPDIMTVEEFERRFMPEIPDLEES